MNTNSMTLSDFGDSIAANIIGTASDGLEYFTTSSIDNAYADTFLAALVAVLVSFAVVWGVWFVARKLYRSVKTVR